MSPPSGRVIRLRERLADFIEPRPAVGTAWCVDCWFNRGRTWEMPASVAQSHTEKHRDEDTAVKGMRIKISYGKDDLP